MFAPMLLPDVRNHRGDEVRASPGRNPRTYPVIVPRSYAIFAAVYIVITVCTNASVGWLTWYDGQITDLLTEPRTWCVVTTTPTTGNVDFMSQCIDSSMWWDSSGVTPADYFDGAPCEWIDEVEPTVGFCNSGNASYAWCENIYNRVVIPNAFSVCGSTVNYLTPSNFSAFKYLNAEPSDYDNLWMWVYPALLNFFLLFLVGSMLRTPRSIRRVGDSFEIQSPIRTERVPLAQVYQLIAFDRFNWCLHRYIVRGLRYITFSCWCGAYANNTPLVVIITRSCNYSSYRLALSPRDYEEFMADNVARLAMPVGYGTIAVRVDVNPVIGAGLPVASVAGGFAPSSSSVLADESVKRAF